MKDDQMPFGDAEFADNAEQRCPCILLLDTSGSMQGEAIDQLNEGLVTFRRELASDGLAAKRVDIAVVTFGDQVDTVCQFGTVETFQPPLLAAKGGTPMGEAVERGLDLLEARKSQYRENGIPYYRPWMFLITDGVPTDKWKRAARGVADAEHRKQVAFYAVGVDQADMDMLGELSVRTPLHLRGLAFVELFRWLSSSLSSVSRSNPGTSVALQNPAAPGGWATVD
jgi:uncharacterized protein YegL